MAIDSLSGAATNNATTAAKAVASSRIQIASNFNQFLTLLTTQLKNQNPLDPLDTNQFTQQLVQFASVEQQLQTNDTLTALLKSTQAASATSALGFVGTEIVADGATSHLTQAGAQWRLTAPRAGQATITITNSSGSVVASNNVALQAGAQTYTWDGRTSTGVLAPEGDCTITVTAKDATGQGLTVSTEMRGIVDAVDMTGDAPVLMVGTMRIPLGNVKSMRRPS
jgi:flagellar basal-body rod modification protein FlgD